MGNLLLLSDGVALTGLYMEKNPDPQWVKQDELEVFKRTENWLDAYFSGTPRPIGELPLKLTGTPVQMAVWEILTTIPWGETRTYGDIAREMARRLGKEKMSAQAVGQAVGRNPIWIIVPCHRVVGAGGKLTGYAGGIEKKAWLLCHEEEQK